MDIVRPPLGYLKDKLEGSDLYNSLLAIRDKARDEAIESGLPGHISGPNDALRHIIGAAEAIRQHGEAGAGALIANEIRGSYYGDGPGGQTAADRAMDDHNNLIGALIGRTAKSYEEIVERAKAEIAKAIENEGSGKDGSPKWLDPSQWKTANGEPDRRPIPENFGKPPQSGEATGEDNSGGAEPRAARMSAILAKPGRDWTDEDARVVMSDPRYWDPRRKEPALIERVNDSFHQRYDGPNGGPIQVDAYARADGTQVAAHTRAEPKRDRMPDAPTPMPQATPVPHASVVPRAKPVRGNRPPPRRKGRP
jgi:hypothetical protein